jgi:hypothetical protein
MKYEIFNHLSINLVTHWKTKYRDLEIFISCVFLTFELLKIFKKHLIFFPKNFKEFSNSFILFIFGEISPVNIKSCLNLFTVYNFTSV